MEDDDKADEAHGNQRNAVDAGSGSWYRAVGLPDLLDQRKIMLDFNRFEWLSFDCYGTLVDWETAISAAVSEVLKSRGMGMTRTEILGLFANVEPRVQGSETFLKYRDVLRRVMEFMGSELGARFGGA